MTGQIPDNVIYRDEVYALAGVKGEGLYVPLDFGLTPVSPHTANWRGFVSTYEVSNDHLFLKEMHVSIKEKSDIYPDINGIKPESKIEGIVHLDYKGINFKTNFTGKIIIVKDFIDSMYVHMGFQSPLSFRKVIELEFKEGDLISKKDLSDKIQKYRKKDYSDGKIKPEGDLMKWIDRTFSLDYDL
ncbi:MAG: hypothetical protein KGD73_07515 [Candidatus Lokiarchaeota archaeon]|nr:hypothetical protein [Candidatus Lokiarchaeota archaeon]